MKHGVFNPETDIDDNYRSQSIPDPHVNKNILTQPIPDPNRPGFEYDLKLNVLSTKQRLPVYSFGISNPKKKSTSLSRITGTPVNLGPNAYNPNYRKESHVKSDPAVNFTQGPRFLDSQWNRPQHETYALVHSVGRQSVSTKKTEHMFSIGKGKRGVPVGLMTANKLKLQLEHAKY